VTIAAGGVLPKIHPELLARKRGASGVIPASQQDHAPASPVQRKAPAAKKKKAPVVRKAPPPASPKGKAAAPKANKVCQHLGK